VVVKRNAIFERIEIYSHDHFHFVITVKIFLFLFSFLHFASPYSTIIYITKMLMTSFFSKTDFLSQFFIFFFRVSFHFSIILFTLFVLNSEDFLCVKELIENNFRHDATRRIFRSAVNIYRYFRYVKNFIFKMFSLRISNDVNQSLRNASCDNKFYIALVFGGSELT
jgi:cytochrome b subunit of formate dehydrogenase